MAAVLLLLSSERGAAAGPPRHAAKCTIMAHNNHNILYDYQGHTRILVPWSAFTSGPWLFLSLTMRCLEPWALCALVIFENLMVKGS